MRFLTRFLLLKGDGGKACMAKGTSRKSSQSSTVQKWLYKIFKSKERESNTDTWKENILPQSPILGKDPVKCKS